MQLYNIFDKNRKKIKFYQFYNLVELCIYSM